MSLQSAWSAASEALEASEASKDSSFPYCYAVNRNLMSTVKPVSGRAVICLTGGLLSIVTLAGKGCASKALKKGSNSN